MRIYHVPYSPHLIDTHENPRRYESPFHFTTRHLRLQEAKELVQGHGEKVKDENPVLLMSRALVLDPFVSLLPKYFPEKFREIINSNLLGFTFEEWGFMDLLIVTQILYVAELEEKPGTMPQSHA